MAFAMSAGDNTLAGPMTIVIGGNQARVQSDAGQLYVEWADHHECHQPPQFLFAGRGKR